HPALGRRRRAPRADALRQGAQHHRHDRRDPADRHRQEERHHHDRPRDRDPENPGHSSGDGHLRSRHPALPAHHDDDARRALRRHAARHRLRLRRRPAPAARHLDHGRPRALAAAYALHHACGLLVSRPAAAAVFRKTNFTGQARVKPRHAILLLFPLLLSGCAVGPDYKRPDAPTSAEFKEASDAWKQAQPRDEIARGTWWEIFGDPLLNELVAKVDVSNQSLAATEAQFRQAQAALTVARGPFFPSLDGNASITRSRSPTGVVGGTTAGRIITQRSASVS